jgi:hypothetical protein
LLLVVAGLVADMLVAEEVREDIKLDRVLYHLVQMQLLLVVVEVVEVDHQVMELQEVLEHHHHLTP